MKKYLSVMLIALMSSSIQADPIGLGPVEGDDECVTSVTTVQVNSFLSYQRTIQC
jgi:hypothetical protein